MGLKAIVQSDLVLPNRNVVSQFDAATEAVRLGKTGHRTKPRTGNQKQARSRIDQLSILPGLRRPETLE